MVEGARTDDKRLGRRVFPALACMGLLACVLGIKRAASTASETTTRAKTHIVTIEGLRFNPPALTVDRGDRIVWVNKDLFPHTVTAEGRAFDSRDIGPNASWTSRASTPGDFPYGCVYHPTMKGRLTIR